jgi:hypothetical protein
MKEDLKTKAIWRRKPEFLSVAEHNGAKQPLQRGVRHSRTRNLDIKDTRQVPISFPDLQKSSHGSNKSISPPGAVF